MSFLDDLDRAAGIESESMPDLDDPTVDENELSPDDDPEVEPGPSPEELRAQEERRKQQLERYIQLLREAEQAEPLLPRKSAAVKPKSARPEISKSGRAIEQQWRDSNKCIALIHAAALPAPFEVRAVRRRGKAGPEVLEVEIALDHSLHWSDFVSREVALMRELGVGSVEVHPGRAAGSALIFLIGTDSILGETSFSSRSRAKRFVADLETLRAFPKLVKRAEANGDHARVDLINEIKTSAQSRLRAVWAKTGIYVSERKPDGANRIRAPKVTDVGVGKDGAFAVFSLPEPHGLGEFKRGEEALRSVLGLPDLQVVPAADRLSPMVILEKPAPEWPDFYLPEPDEFLRVRTEAEAVAGYPGLRMPVGQTLEGDTVAVDLAKAPHVIIAGTTGGGKSRTLLSATSVLLAGGADVVVSDGKADKDFIPLFRDRVPGLRNLALTDAEILRQVQWVYDEVQFRKQVMSDLNTKGAEGNPFRALVCIIDEFADLRKRLEDKDAKNAAVMMSRIDSILAQGRSLRVHLVFATQNVYDNSFRGDLMTNVQTKVSLGPPAPNTLQKIAPETLYNEAVELAALIERGKPGRGMVMAEDPKTKRTSMKLMLAPFVYTPSESIPEKLGPQVVSAFVKQRDELLALRPAFAPRWGVQFDAEPAEDPAVKNPEAREGGWQALTMRELAGLPPIALDDRDGPIAERARYDRTSVEYEGGVAVVNAAHEALDSF